MYFRLILTELVKIGNATEANTVKSIGLFVLNYLGGIEIGRPILNRFSPLIEGFFMNRE